MFSDVVRVIAVYGNAESKFNVVAQRAARSFTNSFPEVVGAFYGIFYYRFRFGGRLLMLGWGKKRFTLLSPGDLIIENVLDVSPERMTHTHRIGIQDGRKQSTSYVTVQYVSAWRTIYYEKTPKDRYDHRAIWIPDPLYKNPDFIESCVPVFPVEGQSHLPLPVDFIAAIRTDYMDSRSQ